MSHASPELALQVKVIRFLKDHLDPDVAWTAVDHAAKLSITRGAQRKAQGVKSGQADLRFVLPPHGRSGEIELKAEGVTAKAARAAGTAPRSAGVQSDRQIEWQAAVEGAGGLYAVARSVDEVRATLTAWRVRLREHPFAKLPELDA